MLASTTGAGQRFAINRVFRIGLGGGLWQFLCRSALGPAQIGTCAESRKDDTGCAWRCSQPLGCERFHLFLGRRPRRDDVIDLVVGDGGCVSDVCCW